MANLESMSLAELKTLAKERNIKNISKLKKEEIVEVLRQIFETDNNMYENKNNNEFQENSDEVKKKLLKGNMTKMENPLWITN